MRYWPFRGPSGRHQGSLVSADRDRRALLPGSVTSPRDRCAKRCTPTGERLSATAIALAQRSFSHLGHAGVSTFPRVPRSHWSVVPRRATSDRFIDRGGILAMVLPTSDAPAIDLRPAPSTQPDQDRFNGQACRTSSVRHFRVTPVAMVVRSSDEVREPAGSVIRASSAGLHRVATATRPGNSSCVAQKRRRSRRHRLSRVIHAGVTRARSYERS